MAKTASGDLYLAPSPPRSPLSSRTHFHPSPPTDAQFPFRPLFNRCSWILILQGIIEKRIMRFDRSSIFLSRIRYLVQSVLLFSFLRRCTLLRNKFYKIKLLWVLFSSTAIIHARNQKEISKREKIKVSTLVQIAYLFFFFFLIKCRVKLKTLSTSRDHIVMQNGKLRFNVKITGIADNILTSDSGDWTINDVLGGFSGGTFFNVPVKDAEETAVDGAEAPSWPSNWHWSRWNCENEARDASVRSNCGRHGNGICDMFGIWIEFGSLVSCCSLGDSFSQTDDWQDWWLEFCE